MSEPKSFHLSRDIHDYIVEHGTPPDDVQRALIDRTAELGGIAMMQVAPEQGALLTLLVRALGVRNAVEVGTFTGYSALCIARGLPEGGRLLCCDVSEEWTSVGREFWRRAGVDDRIELRIAPGIETLRSLPEEPTIDFAFIDADKPSYIDYYEALVPRVRANGVLMIDNVLWSGRVIDPTADDDNSRAVKAFNDHVAADDRVMKVMLAVSDGITLICKR